MPYFDDYSTWDDDDDAGGVTPDNVMLLWRESVRGELPWSSMPLDDRTGTIRPIIDELLDVSTGLACPIRRRNIQSAAAAHGAFRRAQRCDDHVLIDDFTMLRAALDIALRQSGKSRTMTREALKCLLPDWRMARRAAREAFAAARRGRDPRID
jgi:hypothetical protein